MNFPKFAIRIFFSICFLMNSFTAYGYSETTSGFSEEPYATVESGSNELTDAQVSGASEEAMNAWEEIKKQIRDNRRLLVSPKFYRNFLIERGLSVSDLSAAIVKAEGISLDLANQTIRKKGIDVAVTGVEIGLLIALVAIAIINVAGLLTSGNSISPSHCNPNLRVCP